MLVARLRIVLVAIVPALAQDGEFDVVPAEEPASACAWGPVTLPPRAPLCQNALNPSDYVPGECMVSYEAVEAMWAASQENAKDTFEHRVRSRIRLSRSHAPRWVVECPE